METGKIPKRSRAENDNKIKDTDTEERSESRQQPSSRNIINKRRRKIVDDDEDDDDADDGRDVEVEPHLGGHSNSESATPPRSTRSSRTPISTAAASDPQGDVSVSDPSFTRRRSTRSSQALQQQERSEEDKTIKSKTIATKNQEDKSAVGSSKKTAYDVDADDGDGDSVVVTSNVPKVLSKHIPTTAGRGKEPGMASPQIISSIGKNSEQPQNRDISTYESDDINRFMNTSTSTTASSGTGNELSKEEKLRKFLATQQQQPRGNGTDHERGNDTTGSNILLAQQKKDCELVVMQDIRHICDQFSHRGSESSNAKKVLLDIQLSSRGRVDLFGSFICTDDDDARQLDDRYDFFDTNNDGEIIVSKPLPIFLDEFPDRKPTHNAAWWGIVEPSLGVGKYKSLHAPSKREPPASTYHHNSAPTVTNDVGIDRGFDNNTSRGRDAGRNNDTKFVNKNERSSSHIVENKQHNYDRVHGKATQL